MAILAILVGGFLLLVGAAMFGITVILVCLTVVLWIVKTVIGIVVWYLERQERRRQERMLVPVIEAPQDQGPITIAITVTILDE